MVNALIIILASLFIEFRTISIHIHELLLRCIVLLLDLGMHNLEGWVLVECVCTRRLGTAHWYRGALGMWWSITISVLAPHITNIEDIHAIVVLHKLSVLIRHVISRDSSVLIALCRSVSVTTLSLVLRYCDSLHSDIVFPYWRVCIFNL